MAKALSVLALAGLALLASAATPIPVSTAPTGASEPIPEAFVSYSIEFAFFPDYAGGVSCPLPNVSILTCHRQHLTPEYLLI
jgi:hypothetical protein